MAWTQAGGRPRDREDVVGGLAEAVEGVGRELGAECDHERVEAQRAAARLYPTAGRIDYPDLRLEKLDPRRQEAPQRARDPLRSATCDEEPEQRGLEQVPRLTLDEGHPVPGSSRRRSSLAATTPPTPPPRTTTARPAIRTSPPSLPTSSRRRARPPTLGARPRGDLHQ